MRGDGQVERNQSVVRCFFIITMKSSRRHTLQMHEQINMQSHVIVSALRTETLTRTRRCAVHAAATTCHIDDWIQLSHAAMYQTTTTAALNFSWQQIGTIANVLLSRVLSQLLSLLGTDG